MTPVILLHGWGGTYAATYQAAGWEPFLRSRDFEPIGIALPGHRATGCSHDPADYSDLAGELAQSLPENAKHCIAFSLGAKIALEIELRSPGRFERMVLGGVGDNVFGPEPAGKAIVEALLGTSSLTDRPPIVQSLMAYVDKSVIDWRALAAVVQRPHNPQHTSERLTRLLTAMLIVNGAEDSAALPDEVLRTAISNAENLILDNCDHVGLTDDHRFMEAAARFLSEGTIER